MGFGLLSCFARGKAVIIEEGYRARGDRTRQLVLMHDKLTKLGTISELTGYRTRQIGSVKKKGSEVRQSTNFGRNTTRNTSNGKAQVTETGAVSDLRREVT